ncbi:DNA/RNA helicase domain-containing protein [Oceanobacillus sojae]|uniref:DNA/RNA helicase domain-containing protein n=1 Tax=Oceanobacillus sojae TaxID=582851 RepID=UPI00362C31A3
MLVYEATKSEFLDDVFNDELTNNIINNFQEKIGSVNKSEVRSWDNSMQYMYRVLGDNDIPKDAGVAIEYRIPYSSKRVDFLITGKKDNKESVVIVELKQWDKVEKVVGKEAIVKTNFSSGLVETTHPSYQAWSYASLIKDYNATVQQDDIDMYPCAYLHNYIVNKESDPLTDDVYQYYIDQAPVYAKGDAKRLREFIKKYIKYGDNKDTLYKIEKGRIRPSKSLQDALNSMLQGNEEFIMIDEQKVVFEEALRLASEAKRTNTKQVLIVEGGPGTGKSVLAVNLLVELTRKSLVAQYVTKNSAPRNIYATKLKQDFKKTQIDNLFKGSGSYVNAPNNEFDVLIVDEAHRLNEKSGMFQNLGENQVKELIHASNMTIFFIDEHQRVTLKDIGSIDLIKKYTNEYNGVVHKLELASQFRCNGSDGYLAWIDNVLQIRETANSNFIGKDYDFRVFDDPNKLLESIRNLNRDNNKARMLAGYCWEWPKESRTKSAIPDIVIPEKDFGISWNLDNTLTWAIDDSSVNEAGCIHTSQGLEFDYVGVIIGDDLLFRDGTVCTDYTKRAKSDRSLFGIKKMIKEKPEEAEKLADEIIRNTYRTLLTRGQKGCFVYCTDTALANYLNDRIEKVIDYESEGFFNSNSFVAEDKGSYK